MGCGLGKSKLQLSKRDKVSISVPAATAIRAALLIQRWYRQYVARLEMRRRCTWNIFQSIEYAGEQDQIKLYNFFGFLMDHLTPASSERNLISHIFRKNEICGDADWERYFCYESIGVPASYCGPHLTFPMTSCGVSKLVEAFKHKQQLHARYVLQLLGETWRLLRILPNINQVSACHTKEITICDECKAAGMRINFSNFEAIVLNWKKVAFPLQLRGEALPRLEDEFKYFGVLFNSEGRTQRHINRWIGDLHGHLEDLLLIFYKNGFPSSEKPYIFNGDFVDRGKNSLEILLILFGFLLVYPNHVHLNRGNHEDHIVNLRYGFTKEVLAKYRVHGRKILKLLQKIFSWLPLATVIDHKVLIVHGGISDTTDLGTIARVDRHKYVSTLRPHHPTSGGENQTQENELVASGLGQSRRRVRSLTHNNSVSAFKHLFPRRSLHNQPTSSQQPNWSVEEELKRRRRLAGFDQSYGEPVKSDSDSGSELEETTKMDDQEWKQIVDILWSDPMPQDGCVPNEVRGGGCYWGPDVTEEVLARHGLQLLIRSHECKQEGYEFCHNRMVLTIFSASNYYEVGSNRGAYIRLGHDLVPHFVQYQASRTSRELTLRQSISWTERSALRALREQLFAHRSDLITAFRDCDINDTGVISLKDWASATERALNLGLPWRVLRPQLVGDTQQGMVDYQQWLREFSISDTRPEGSDNSILETMYRNHSNLETIFRIIDTDHSGSISYEEFRQTWKLLSSHLKIDISDKAIADLASSIDFNKDGSIDINEFMEAFRLANLSACG